MRITKIKKVLLFTLLSALTGCAAAGGWYFSVEAASKKAGLVILDTSGVPEKSNVPPEEHDLDVNGVTLHYAVAGEGDPVVLVHGNGSSHHAFDELIQYLSTDHKVFALDSRCQGQSSEGEISYQIMAKDTAEFIRALGIEKPLLLGHSDGGIVGLYVAILYPDLLGSLIACGANSEPSGLKWSFIFKTKITYALSHNPLHKMMLDEPDISADKLLSIRVPCTIVAGEFDIVRLKDTRFISDNIPNSKIMIIRSASHGSYVHNGKQSYTLIANSFK